MAGNGARSFIPCDQSVRCLCSAPSWPATCWRSIAASFIIGGIFALGLFGISEERALAMLLVVQGASILTVAGIGALALWQQGVALSDVRAAGAANARAA